MNNGWTFGVTLRSDDEMYDKSDDSMQYGNILVLWLFKWYFSFDLPFNILKKELYKDPNRYAKLGYVTLCREKHYSYTISDLGIFLHNGKSHNPYMITGYNEKDVEVHKEWDGGSYNWKYAMFDNQYEEKYSFYSDGEELTATISKNMTTLTHGTGRWSFLRHFFPKEDVYNLWIDFSGEIGTGRGSWKGGTIGSSCLTSKDESIEIAFMKYCDKEMLSFNGRLYAE